MWFCNDETCNIYELTDVGPYTEIVKALWPNSVQSVSVYIVRRQRGLFYQCNVAVIDNNLLLSAAKMGESIKESVERSCMSLLYQLSVLPETYINPMTQQPFQVTLPQNEHIRKPDGTYVWGEQVYFLDRDVPTYP